MSTASTPPTPPTSSTPSTLPFPPLPSRRELRRRAFALHCHGLRPRAIGERLGVPRRTICDWLAADMRILCREHEQLDRDMRRRDVIACCYTISAEAWDRYEHLSDRAQALLAFAWGEDPAACHDDGTPLSAAERRRAAAVADRLRAALPRYLLLAHHAQREVARVQQLYDPSANALPEHDIQFISSPYEPDEEDADDRDGADDDEDDDEEGEEEDEHGPSASVSSVAPTPASAAVMQDDEDEDEDDEDDLPDDDTDMRALEAFRDRLEEYVYRLRQQRAQRAQRAAAAAATAAAASPSDPSPVAGGGVARSAGVGEPSTARSLSAPDRPPTPADALDPHEIGTADETPPCEIENLAETATTSTSPAPPPSDPGDVPSHDVSLGRDPDCQ